MPYQTVTLSSANVPGQSGVAALSWRSGQPTTVAIYGSTGQTSTFNLQYTMDDVQLIGGSSLAQWASVSSAVGTAGTVFTSSTITPDGLFWQFLTPIAALRLSSTALSSGPLIMKVIQGEP